MEGGRGGGAATGIDRCRLNRERKGKGGLMGGATLSATAGKRKRGDVELGCCGRGLMGRWAGWAKREVRSFFSFFFFFFFKLFSNQTFSTQIQTKTFQTFSQHFINLLYITQATKNHA
jgi:hypothetical protein